MTPSAPLVGTVLDGKFQIEKALASGASGDVYEAVHLGLGSRVAVKILRPGIPETAHIRRKRFVREARVAARIQSDHVVRVFDIVAPEEGLIYIVMELLEGETLADRIRRVGAMAPAEAVGYLMQAAKPLAQMHDAGIVHRDVKPSNVFLARDADGTERIKLLDFGVAAFQQPVARGESSITFSDAIVGTPRYMAPEQVRASKDVDARADVWALGATLYELLSGSQAFDGQTVLAVLNQIEQQEPRRLDERQPGVSPGLADVVHRCLAKEPARRPADARALGEALAPFAGEAQARRPSDPLDLSLSDENVEVVRESRPKTLRARFTALGVRRKAVLMAAFVSVITVLLFAIARPPVKLPIAASPAPPPSSIPDLIEAPAPAPSPEPAAPAASALVRSEPSRDTPSTRRAAESPRPVGAQRHPAKAAPRPSATKTPPSRPPAEDDDRIE